MKKGIEVKIEFKGVEKTIRVMVDASNGCGCKTVYQCPACEENGGCGKPAKPYAMPGNGDYAK